MIIYEIREKEQKHKEVTVPWKKQHGRKQKGIKIGMVKRISHWEEKLLKKGTQVVKDINGVQFVETLKEDTTIMLPVEIEEYNVTLISNVETDTLAFETSFLTVSGFE